ncbi:MAG: flavodoxin family protein [Desulfuromonadales bacterium]|nr:flavodoxin family protein [Desulfuromonadales bacterium]
MNKPITVTAIVGSYRRGGIIDRAVDEILAAAREAGADTEKILLMDRRIEFCTNCRTCTQQAGAGRGACATVDDMGPILDRIEASDAIVLASPMNFGTVTAIMKRFIERLACYAYWPWGQPSPKMRNQLKGKRAVLVASSAAPALLARLLSKIVGSLKQAADVLGAKTIGVLFMGLAAQQPHQELGERTREKARKLGKKLASQRRKE